MNVVAHQKKKGLENTGKREAGEENKRHVTDFKETECYPFAVV